MNELSKNIHSIRDRNQKLEQHYLLTVYKLADGNPYIYTNVEGVALELKISVQESNLVLTRLRDKKLIDCHHAKRTAITIDGINLAEKIIEESNEEKEYVILKHLYEKTKINSDGISSNEIAQSLGLEKDEVEYILLDFGRKEWVTLTFGLTAQINPQGVTAFDTWKKSHKPFIGNIYNTTILGNSNNQIGGYSNAQNAINSTNMNIDDRTKNRYQVLEEIYNLSNANSVEPVVIDTLEKTLQIDTYEMNGILSYLESRGLIDFRGGDIVQIKSRGIDEIEQAKNQPQEKTANFPPQINYVTNVQGNFYGGLQQGGAGNTQNNQINVNPEFDNAIKGLIELVNNSDLHFLEKEERLAEIERIKQLAQKEQTPEVKQLGASKVKVLETALKVGEMALKASPLIGILAKVFAS